MAKSRIYAEKNAKEGLFTNAHSKIKKKNVVGSYESLRHLETARFLPSKYLEMQCEPIVILSIMIHIYTEKREKVF